MSVRNVLITLLLFSFNQTLHFSHYLQNRHGLASFLPNYRINFMYYFNLPISPCHSFSSQIGLFTQESQVSLPGNFLNLQKKSKSS